MRAHLFYNVGGYSVWTVPNLPKGKKFWTADEAISNREDRLIFGVSKKVALRVMKSHNKALDNAVSCDIVKS